jgi:hypothetical protein
MTARSLNRMGALCRALGSFLVSYWHHSRSMQRDLFPDLYHFLKNSDGSFSPSDVRRIKHYTRYAPLGLAYSFAMLRRRAISERERKLQLYLCALVPMIDDIFDAPDLLPYTPDALLRLMQDPQSRTPVNTRDAVFIHFWQLVYPLLPDSPLFYETLHRAFAAQAASREQTQAGISQARLRQLSFDKGGYAALLFRALMEHPLSDEERAVSYLLGAITQFSDDIFDVYEDTHTGVYTLANTQTDMYVLKQQYTDCIRDFCEKSYALTYRKKDISLFIDKVLLVFVRAQVATEQLCRLQEAHGGVFHASIYARKPLITDMETWHNIRRAWQLFRDWRE